MRERQRFARHGAPTLFDVAGTNGSRCRVRLPR